MQFSSHRWFALVLIGGVSCHGAPIKKPANQVPSAPQTERQSAILYGRDFSYAVSAPRGWILDSEAGKGQGLSVVFYRRGQSWQNGEAVIYINVNDKRPGVSLAQFAAEDVADFKKNDPHLAIHPASPLKISNGSQALTFTFLPAGGQPPYEKSAYIEMPTIRQTVVLTAKTRAAYNAALADYESLIASLSFLTAKVKIEKPKHK